MTYAQRQINLTFQQPNGESIHLPGLKVAAIVDMPGGIQAMSSLQMNVWGMTLAHMNQFSSAGSQMVALSNYSVTVTAGDLNGKMSNVFEGAMCQAYMDFSAIPDVSFVVAATAGFFWKGTPAAPHHYAGPHNAEDIIRALAQQIGYNFVNDNGAHAVITDQYLYGSPVQNIQRVAAAARFAFDIHNDTVTIWPNEGVRDNVIIDVGPQTGLVGYPSYYEAGFMVRSQFNPDIVRGRRIQLTSSIPKSNGLWPIQTVTHELSTQQEDGPWFTTVRLCPPPYVPNN